MIEINTKRNMIIAGIVVAAVIVGLFIAAIEHIERTTPQRMEQLGTNDYYDQVVQRHLENR